MRKFTHEQWLRNRIEEEIDNAFRKANKVMLQFFKGEINYKRMDELLNSIDDDATQNIGDICMTGGKRKI